MITSALTLYAIADGNYSRRSTYQLLGLVAVAAMSGGVRLIFGAKISNRGLCVDVVIGLVAITLLEVVGSSADENFAVLYFWIAVYAGLYFRPRIASIYLVGIAISHSAALLLEGSGQALGFAWASTVVTALIGAAIVMALVGELNEKSHFDSLSSLSNRLSWDERFEIEFANAKQLALPLTLAIIDVGDFKSVNDREGHLAGDKLLLDLANGWRKEVRTSDFLARFGGDEFGLLAPGSSAEDLVRVVDRLPKVNPEGITCSIGVVAWNSSESKTELFRRGDEAMYLAKRERHKR